MMRPSDLLMDEYFSALLREDEGDASSAMGLAGQASSPAPSEQGRHRMDHPQRVPPAVARTVAPAEMPVSKALAGEEELLEGTRREALQAMLQRSLPAVAQEEPSRPAAVRPVETRQSPASPQVLEQPQPLEIPEPAEKVQQRDRVVKTRASAGTAPATAPQVVSAIQTASAPAAGPLTWCDNGRPLWAQEGFDALLFRVNGLAMAVPLVTLGQIHPLTAEITPLFGQAKWFMGLLPSRQGQIRVVNTALFVMPERYSDEFLDTARYVVSIADLDWGLAVDSVEQPLRLKPDDVTWRGERSKRPWLAGTVKAALCALIDIPQMGQMLRQADRNSSHQR